MTNEKPGNDYWIELKDMKRDIDADNSPRGCLPWRWKGQKFWIEPEDISLFSRSDL